MAEFKKQRELLHAESIKRLDLLLRDPDPTITPDNRKLYEELILENMSNG